MTTSREQYAYDLTRDGCPFAIECGTPGALYATRCKPDCQPKTARGTTATDTPTTVRDAA